MDNEQLKVNNGRKEMQGRGAIPLALFMVLFSLLISCYTSFDTGKGYFSLAIDGASGGRTILPQMDQENFGVYKLEFFAAGTGILAFDPIIRNNENLSDPIVMNAGTWDLFVNAYMDMADMEEERPAADGGLRIVIGAGETTVRTVMLGPIMEGDGKGTFSWNIDYPARVAAATMTITRWPISAQTEAEAQTIDLGDNKKIHSVELAPGYYRVAFRLADAWGVSLEHWETLHIYQSMESVFAETLRFFTPHDVEDFGPKEIVDDDNIFDVPNADRWAWAVNEIKTRGDDKNYIVNITGNFDVAGSSGTEATFGDASGIKVSLRGVGADTVRTVSLSSTSNGNMLRIGSGQDVALRDVALRGHGSNTASLVHVDGGTFMMQSGTITGNTTNTYAGGGVDVASSSSLFTMNGGEISGNAAPSGGGVHVRGTFTMNGGKISNNNGNGIVNGGGVYVSDDGGIFTMEGGEISGNKATNTGGGVGVYGNGTFTMNGGTIYSNTATYHGGGVYVYNGATFTMNGGKIASNLTTATADATGGGGVSVSGGAFTMNDGEISKNTATQDGGGVYTANGGTFTMYDGTISGNKATHNGGGVYAGSGTTFTMHNGKILGGNTANGGGGVTARGNFTMHDGKISGNEANVRGSGVDVYSGTFIMQGGEISGNTAPIGGGVYVLQNGIFRIVTGTIYGSNAADTSLRNTAGSGAAVYKDGTAQYGTFNGTNWVSTGNLYTNNYPIRVVDGVMLDFYVASTAEWEEAAKAIAATGSGRNYTINVTANFNVDGKASNTFGNASNVSVTLQSADTVRTLSMSGNGDMLFIGNNQSIILRALTLNGNSSNINSVVHVGNNGTFAMYSGKISGNTATNGGGVYVGGGTFTMNGGEISGNKAADTGGGVGVYGSSGTFTMYEGTISGNTATNDGGGVYVASGSTFTMRDGKILGGNTANGGGGVTVRGTFAMHYGKISGNNGKVRGGGVYVWSGAFTMHDGEISGNTGGGGGGVAQFEGGTFTMHNGKISSNTSADGGGGVRMTAANSTFTMYGGEVSNNTDNTCGGGVYVTEGGAYYMYNGKISGNTTGGDGGGVCVDKGIFRIDGGEISGNTSTHSTGGGGGVWVNSGATFIMADGKIANNRTTSAGGGGVHVNGNTSTFYMYGGEILGNTAPSNRDGGGVYVNAGTFRLITGTIYGSTDSNANLRNTARSGAALYRVGGTVQRGTFNGNTWNNMGDLGTTNSTIRVEGGNLQ